MAGKPATNEQAGEDPATTGTVEEPKSEEPVPVDNG